MTDFKKGFLAAVLAVAAAVFLLPLVPAIKPPFIAEAVTCFPMPSTAGLMPEVKSLLNKNTSDEAFIEREQHSMEAFYVGAEEAKTNCSTSSCEPTGWKAYRTAIADYVSRRENVTRNLYRKRGDEGLEIASRVFGTERDRDIIKHLKEVSTAEKFEINKLGIAKQSAALLVHRGPDSYKPCSDPDHVTSP